MTYDSHFPAASLAWELVKEIQNQSSTTSGGFTNLKSDGSGEQADLQPSVFLGATLKYLYLTIADPKLLSRDQWVFNAVGQPLPVCGRNPAYRKEKCF